MEKKKVLVVGINPWIDNTGINTLIDFFDGWGVDHIAHIYTREKLPNTHICNTFFRISEPKVLRSLLKRAVKTGEKVENTPPEQNIAGSSLYGKPAGTLKRLLQELVWKFGRWKTPELDDFLGKFAPDVLFFPVYANVYMCRLQNYIAKKTGKPVVLYSSDDNYSYQSIQKKPLSLLHRSWLRKQEKKLFQRAKKVLVISPKQKEEYDALFHTDCGVLTKGIDFETENLVPDPLHKPLRMVYTGKLIIGRWKSLAAIAEALGEINQDEPKMELHIYTTDTLTKEQEIALNRNGSMVKGSLTLEGVRKVQQDADILVFVESLEKKYKYTARLSFSTKITDYLKSGKCIFAIGDKDIAPMDYFLRYDSAVTATTYGQVAEKLKALVRQQQIVQEYAQKAYACGRTHHNREKMEILLRDTIMEAARN